MPYNLINYLSIIQVKIQKNQRLGSVIISCITSLNHNYFPNPKIK